MAPGTVHQQIVPLSVVAYASGSDALLVLNRRRKVGISEVHGSTLVAEYKAAEYKATELISCKPLEYACPDFFC